MSPQERIWETRIWTITQVLMVAATAWVGSTLVDLSKTVVRIDTRLSAAIEAQTQYAVTQAARDRTQDEEIKDLRRAIEAAHRRGNP